MQLRIPQGGRCIISDDDPRAIKIRQGYSYDFENSELVVSDQKDKPDFSALLTKLNGKTATDAEVQSILHYLDKFR